MEGLDSVFSSFTCLRSVMFLSKDDSDFLHDEEVTNPLAKIWHRSCPSLEIVSFPDSIWYVVFLFFLCVQFPGTMSFPGCGTRDLGG